MTPILLILLSPPAVGRGACRGLAALLGSACGVLPASLLAQEAAAPLDLGTITTGVSGPIGPEASLVAERTAAGSRIDTAVIDLPASVSVITEGELERRGVEDIPQALAYTSGVTTDEYGGDDRYDYLRIRGFYQTSLGYYRDGLPVRSLGFTGSRLEPFGLQRIEVLKGSTSTLFGLNAPGGLVNAVTKRPQDQPFGESSVVAGPDHLAFGLDTGRPLDADGAWTYRLTALSQDGDNGGDYSQDDRLYVAPALTWRPSEATSVTLLADYSRRQDNVGSAIPLGSGIDPDTYLGERGFDGIDREETSLGWDASHRFGNGLTVSQTARWSELDLDYEQIYGAGLSADIPRLAYAVDGHLERFAINSQLLYEASFGAVRSRTLVGLDHSRDEARETYGFGTAPGLDPYDPVYTGRGSVEITGTAEAITRIEDTGLFLQEELTFDDRLILTLGGRYDWVSTEEGAPGATSSFEDQAFTSRVGLTYKVTPDLSVYANYSESFEPTAGYERTGLSNVDPREGTQYELGAKFRPANGDALLTAAIFDLSQTNLVTQVSPLVSEQVGEVRVRGLELEGKWEMARGLSLTASYAYLDPEIVEDGVGGNQGNQPALTPEHAGSIWADYAVPAAVSGRALTLGSGVRFVGSSFSDNANAIELDGYATVDAAARLQLTDDIALGLTVTNLLDRREVVNVSTFTANESYNDARELRASLTYTW